MYLNCHTYYSLRFGTFPVAELCKLANQKGAAKLAVTDINTSTACLEFLKIAKDFGIEPLVGIDFRDGAQQQYVGIARNNEGYRQLNEHLSNHLHASKNFDDRAPLLPDCFVIYPLEKVISAKKRDFKENELIGVSIESLRKLKFSAYKELKNKLVVLQTVTFRNKRDFNAHRLLRAIDNNMLLSQLPETEQGSYSHRMPELSELEQEFEDFPHILDNTKVLMDSCQVNFKFSKLENRNLQVAGNSLEEDADEIRRLCYDKLPEKYPKADETVYKRVEKELNTIIRLKFVSYFLINLEIVNYAKKNHYPFVGRGSGANSIVAYILGITNVDPIELDLYFERFINPNRSSPPDFDIDFSWKDRNDVTRYIFDTYENTALMGTYVTFKRRAVARELGKVFGLPKENIDKLSQGFFNYQELDHLEKLVLQYSQLIAGFPNYLSVHSGGILILDDSVHNYAGTFLPPKGFRTIQIDMNIAEDVGIHKFDILAQRGLSKITDAIELIKRNQPEAKLENIENIDAFKKDPEINALLKVGDCMGVFYVESPAMRGLLTKLQTDNYLNLVAASSVIRPGISSAGMKEEFIRRHRFPELQQNAHPVLLDIMPDTYGVMVYQEDVMKVAYHFAGLNLDDADVLRRGMSGKKTSQGQMEKIEETFRRNCKEKGYQDQLTDEVWEQISSFAGYAFPKGHSASYAVESYQSLYLKRYFPLEFMVAAINNGGGFYRLETYIQEIRRCGGRVHAPCINKSDHPNTIYGKDIYLGLGYIRELEAKTIRHILENRQFFGEFQSLDDFIDRVPISIEQLSLLLKINAFRFTGYNKHHLLWKAYFKLNHSAKRSGQAVLFKPPHRDFELPEFEFSRISEAYDQMELLGFPLCSHFELLKEPPESALLAKDLKKHIGKEVKIYGNLVNYKKNPTSNGKYMFFGTFYDQQGGIFDIVLFPQVARHYDYFNYGIYACYGTVTEDLGHLCIDIKWLKRQATHTDPRLVNSSHKVKLPA